MSLATVRRPRRYSRSRRMGASGPYNVSANVLAAPTGGTVAPTDGTAAPPAGTTTPAAGTTPAPAGPPPWDGFAYRGTDATTGLQNWMAQDGTITQIPASAGWPVPKAGAYSGQMQPGAPLGNIGDTIGHDGQGNPIIVGQDGKATVQVGNGGSPGSYATPASTQAAIAAPPASGDLASRVAPGANTSAVDPRLSSTPQGPTAPERIPSMGAQDALIASGRVARAWSDGIAIFDHGGVIDEPVSAIGVYTGKRYLLASGAPAKVTPVAPDPQEPIKDAPVARRTGGDRPEYAGDKADAPSARRKKPDRPEYPGDKGD